MKFIFTLSLVFSAICCFGQHNGIIRGTLIDSITKQPVGDATITVMNPADSSLVTFTRSLSTGQFLLRGLNHGNFRLLITHVSYHNFSAGISLNEAVNDITLGNLLLTNKSVLLSAVTVNQEAAPVTIKKDTIEFNAGSFKTKPNAVVEDLLKKLPGVQVDKNGTIKANGEEVKKVMVDGKEFFGNDPKIASKNLPADAVDKVQVFDKKSDQSQFTGFDDGNSEKTINLTIKQNKKNGLFGKATAGAGNHERYEGKLNMNKFSGPQQLSVIGMGNNTNKQGFAFQEVMNFSGGMQSGGRGGLSISLDPFSSGLPIQGGGQSSQAITTTWAGGLNFNDTWNKRTDLNGSYFYNKANDRLDQHTATQYLLPGNGFTQVQQSSGNRQNENHRLNFATDYRIDSSSSFRFMSSFVHQSSNQSVNNTYHSQSDAGSLLNQGFSNSNIGGTAFNWNNNALLRHRFAKKGRTISLNLNAGFTANDGAGKLFSQNNYFHDSSISSADTLNQVNDISGRGNNLGAAITYTEPLSKKNLLEFTYRANTAYNHSEKHTFNADGNGKYILPDEILTNAFENRYSFQREGFGWKNQQEKINFTIGLEAQQARMNTSFHYLGYDSSLRRSFVDLLPNANLQYNFSKYQNLRAYYFTFTRQPDVSQLQPVADNSDPLNIRAGNPNLDQEYYHLIRLNYIAFDPFRHTNFFGSLNYTATQHKIVNNDVLDSVGGRISKPVNLEGLYNLSSNLSWGFPLRKIKSNLNLNTTGSLNHNAALVNGVRNNGDVYTIGESAELNYYYKEIFDITATVNLNYNNAHYSLQNGQNQQYWTSFYGLEINTWLPHGFSIATDLDYTHRTGLPAGYNASPLIWNAGFAKQLFRNKKAELRLQIFDILNEAKGISRNTSQNYIQDVSYRVLNQYWLLSFTWSINRFAGKSIQTGPQRNADIKVISN